MGVVNQKRRSRDTLKTVGKKKEEIDWEAWSIAAAIYPDLMKLCDRISCISQSSVDECALYLLETKEFEERNTYISSVEEKLLDELCDSNEELVQYARFILDNEHWDVMRFFVTYIRVVGGDVDIELIKSRIKVVFPEMATFLSMSNDNDTIIEIGRVTRVSSGTKVFDSGESLANLKKSWVGSLYRGYIKQLPLARKLFNWIWRNGYPFYVNQIATRFVNGEDKKWRSLIRLSEYVGQYELTQYKLADAEMVKIESPRLFPIDDQGILVRIRNDYRFPDIFITCVNEALTYGGTNLVLANGDVICQDLYDVVSDYTSEELHGRTVVDKNTGRIRWLLHDKTPEHISVAATFVDACSVNYAHWLSEIFPRIALFCATDDFKGVPIIVNDGLHENIMQSLFMLVGNDREVITLPIGRALNVDRLYLTSVTGYVPFEPRQKGKVGGAQGVFSPYSFKFVRALLDEYLENKRGNKNWPHKIFLRRNSCARNLVNADVIEGVFISMGYTIVEPEKLSFLQQVELFANAKVIIGSTGAAFANAIFCKSRTNVGILISKHEDMSYDYWASMLGLNGVKVSYILGDIVENHECGVHGDFYIDPQAVNEYLEALGVK